MSWKYGKAQRSDFARINELFIEMLQSIYGTEQVTGYVEGDLDRFFEGAEDWICTVTEAGRIIAFLSIEVHREEQDFLYLDDLSVAAQYRNKGIGSTLIQRAEAYAKAKHIREIRFHVEKENVSALCLYERLGYSVCEEQGSRYLMKKYGAGSVDACDPS